MPSETRPASNFKLENIVSDGKIVNNMLRFVCSKAEYPPFCPNADKTDAGGFAFEVQLSLTEKGQYAVAYGLSCKKDCHELHATDPRRTIP
ncbi:hypothetical protein M5028_06350, partial [Neisseria meningitidis]|nr:hypothetical protein [Neisseria meningitidis]MCL4995466.1 hypothetical protein [Neisseria meningitidis]MCL5707837.1 hypothetical protein [Neisseria meningitidis]MCL5725903.1 hypothetical protein [Neisseria meningitidis]MCL5760659.1 hypothetical protein [Neisseria meningitidis]